MASDWDNHALGLSGDLEFTKYHDNVEENSLDLNIGANGRLDVLEKSNLNGSLNVARKHQDRGDPDDDVAGVVEAELTIFRTASLTFGGEYNADAILLRLNANVNRTDFDDAGATNNDDRDRVEFETRGRVGYEWVPGSTAFVEAALDIREFDKAVDDNRFKRSSHGYEILLGNTLDLTGVTFAELGLGYIRQDFGDQPAGTPNLGPTQGFSFKSDLVWNPTDLLSVTSTMRRTVNETTVLGAASALTSSFGLRVDYGILENLILDAGADLDIESFDGIDREDKNLEMKLGAEYLIGANFIAAAKYSYEERFSDEPGGSFVTNTFMIPLAARL